MRGLRAVFVGVIGAGFVILGVLGGGLVSLLSDTALFDDNTVTATELSGFDITVVAISFAEDCADQGLTFTDNGVATASILDVDTIPTSGVANEIVETMFICLRNNSNTDGDVVVDFLFESDLEVGPCSPEEDTVGLDADCAAGNPGELATHMLRGLVDTSPTDACAFPTEVGVIIATSPSNNVGVLPANETCEIAVNIIYGDASSSIQEVSSVQSDVLTYDILFTLQDVP